MDVEGSLPGWLVGTLYRNGPGQFEAGDTQLRHWFDPYALLRGFRIDGRENSVRYTNRFVRSDDFLHARSEGGVRRMLPGTPPDRSVVTRLRHTLGGAFQDNPSIGVQRIGSTVSAVTESPTGIDVDGETLETTGRRDLTTGLDGVDITLGHPHYDPDRDVFVNLGVSYGRETTYTVFERDADTGLAEVIGRVSFDDAPYAHSFAITDQFAVIAAIPFGLDASGLLVDSVTGGTFVENVTRFDRDARFVVVDRETGAVVCETPADPFFVYHHANAYAVDDAGRPVDGGSRGTARPTDDALAPTAGETATADETATAGETATADETATAGETATADETATAGETASEGETTGTGDPTDEWVWVGDEEPGEAAELVIDLVAYPDERAITGLRLDELRSSEPDVPTGDLVRYRVPLDGSRARRETLYEGQVEFPTIDYRNLVGRRHRYVYLAANAPESSLPTRLVKYDTRTGERTEWTPEGDRYPAEPLFEPAPGAAREDAGVILTTVLDADAERTVFVALDARDMSVVARAPLPHRLPYGFHGQFYRDSRPVRSMA